MEATVRREESAHHRVPRGLHSLPDPPPRLSGPDAATNTAARDLAKARLDELRKQGFLLAWGGSDYGYRDAPAHQEWILDSFDFGSYPKSVLRKPNSGSEAFGARTGATRHHTAAAELGLQAGWHCFGSGVVLTDRLLRNWAPPSDEVRIYHHFGEAIQFVGAGDLGITQTAENGNGESGEKLTGAALPALVAFLRNLRMQGQILGGLRLNGDLRYPAGPQSQNDPVVQALFGSFPDVVVFPVLGNHDFGDPIRPADPGAFISYAERSLGRVVFPGLYHCDEHWLNNEPLVRFLNADSSTLLYDKTQQRTLRKWLVESEAKAVVVQLHHGPMCDVGHGDSPYMQQVLAGILEGTLSSFEGHLDLRPHQDMSCKVRLIWAGHDHSGGLTTATSPKGANKLAADDGRRGAPVFCVGATGENRRERPRSLDRSLIVDWTQAPSFGQASFRTEGMALHLWGACANEVGFSLLGRWGLNWESNDFSGVQAPPRKLGYID
jgi:hypothetical protein